MAKAKKIDFGGVDKDIRSGGGAAHLPEGDYLAKIVSSEDQKSSENTGSKRYIRWLFTIVKPVEYKGKKVYMNTFLTPESLWNLRNLIHAATGKNVAGKAVTFNPANLEGKIVAVTLEDNEYTKDGKTKITSQVADVRPKDELEADDEEDESDEEEEVDEEEESEEEDEELEDVDTDDI